MKRAQRIIFNSMTVLSLMMCIATVGVWVRSYWVCDGVSWRYIPQDMSYGEWAGLVSSRGGLMFESSYWHWGIFAGYIKRGRVIVWTHEGASQYPRFVARKIDPDDVLRAQNFRALGFEVGREVVTDYAGSLLRERRTYATVPLPAIVAVTAFLPVFAVRRRMRERCAKEGHCLVCNYDLRATPDRCPECGTIPEKLKV